MLLIHDFIHLNEELLKTVSLGMAGLSSDPRELLWHLAMQRLEESGCQRLGLPGFCPVW